MKVNGRVVLLSNNTGSWTYAGPYDECKYCGNKNGHDYIEEVCWKCWRSRNPGLLSR